MTHPTTENSRKPFRLALPKLFQLKKKKGFSRRHDRHDCVVIGVMKVIDIGAEFDGALTEISCGGCTFRQASMFVLDRQGESVLIHTKFFEAEGRIRAVRPDGYGVQFFSEVDTEVIDRIAREYGFKVSESFLAKRN
jgi:PilZ domain